MQNTDLERISVVAGIIFNKNKEVLIGSRKKTCDYAGYWEFPGGKIEPSETEIVALKRELKEEIGISVTDSFFFMEVPYDYASHNVQLQFRLVFDFDGEPKSLENQELMWIDIGRLTEIKMLAANTKVIEKLKMEFQ